MNKFPMTDILLPDGRFITDYDPIVELYLIHSEKETDMEIIDNKVFINMNNEGFGLYLIIEEGKIRYAHDYEEKQFKYKGR